MQTTTESNSEVRSEIAELLRESAAAIAAAKDFLVSEGKVIDTTKYLTIKRYCEKYNIAEESVVTNWIRRGIIPAGDVIVIEELNKLRLVADRPYK